jgi:hypothetical protein
MMAVAKFAETSITFNTGTDWSLKTQVVGTQEMY